MQVTETFYFVNIVVLQVKMREVLRRAEVDRMIEFIVVQIKNC